MSKELVLLPKRKYEELVQQKGESESIQKSETKSQTNISTPPDDKDNIADLKCQCYRGKNNNRKWKSLEPMSK